jgi:hypothetical protein
MFSSVKHSSLSQCGQKKLCNIWPNAQMKKKHRAEMKKMARALKKEKKAFLKFRVN